MTSFTAPRRVINWHPGHQKAALRQLKDGIHQVDLVLEVRDARIPLSSANPQFEEVLGRRDKILILNKADLANHNMNENVSKVLKQHMNHPILFTSVQRMRTLRPILDVSLEKMRREPLKYPFLSLVLVGLPNVGKSSLINALRLLGVGKSKASDVAPHAGVTQSIQTRVKIHNDPPIYLVDTPGILNPVAKSPIESLRIALTGAVKDRLADEMDMCSYLLFRLNQSPVCIKRYTNLLGLDRPAIDLEDFLTCIQAWSRINRSFVIPDATSPSVSRGASSERRQHSPPPRKVPLLTDRHAAAMYAIRLFREGAFGPLTLDDCSEEGILGWVKAWEEAKALGAADAAATAEAAIAASARGGRNRSGSDAGSADIMTRASNVAAVAAAKKVLSETEGAKGKIIHRDVVLQ